MQQALHTTRFESNQLRYNEIVERLKDIVRDKGLNIVQLSIAWVLRKSAVTCVLVGAKNPQQVIGLIDRVLADSPEVPHS